MKAKPKKDTKEVEMSLDSLMDDLMWQIDMLQDRTGLSDKDMLSVLTKRVGTDIAEMYENYLQDDV